MNHFPLPVFSAGSAGWGSLPPQAPGRRTWLAAGRAVRHNMVEEGSSRLRTSRCPEGQVTPTNSHKGRQADTPSCTQPARSTARRRQSGDNAACATQVVSFLSPLCPPPPAPHPQSPSLPRTASHAPSAQGRRGPHSPSPVSCAWSERSRSDPAVVSPGLPMFWEKAACGEK